MAAPPAKRKGFTDIEDIRRAVSANFLKACESLYWLNPRSNIDPETGLPTGKEGLMRFTLYPEQRIQAAAQLQMQREHRPVRVIKLKCRQSGDSTFAAAWTFHGMYWRPRRRALVVTHHESTTNALYMMYQTFYNELPEELKWHQRRFNRKELSFEPPSGSSLVAQTAGFLDIGHGLTLQDVHLSEIDRWPDPETALEGIMETTPLTAETSIIIESVSDGADGWLHNFWRASREGKTAFLPLFTPVYRIPEYRLPVPADFEATAEEEEWIREYQVKPSFLMWYRAKTAEFIARYPWGGERRLKAMYPFTDEQAFQSSGFCVFPDNVLARARDTVGPPENCVEPIVVGPGQFRAQRADWGEDNAVALWEKPNPNYSYSIGLDIADGVGATESVASIWRYPGYEQVGEWGSKHSSLEHTAWVANWLATIFAKGGARVLMVPEINKSGPLILYILNQIQNPVFDMYRWQYLDKFAPYASDNPKLGWETNDVTKTMLPQVFNKIFMGGSGVVRSKILLEQMGRCVDVLPSRRWRVAGKGSDRVLAGLIAIMGAYVEFEGGQVHGVTMPGEDPDAPQPKRRERGSYDAEWERDFEGVHVGGRDGNYLVQDWDV